MKIYKSVTLTDIVTTDESTVISLNDVTSYSVSAIVDVDVPAADTFADSDVDTDEDTITLSAHDFTTGLKVALTTDGVLPTGLSATNYYVIVVDANTIQLASSLSNALAGTAEDITAAAGGGTHTLTPAAIAGGSIKLQKSNDNSNWSDEGSATNITADGVIWLEKDRPTSRYARVYITLTAGRLSATLHIHGK